MGLALILLISHGHTKALSTVSTMTAMLRMRCGFLESILYHFTICPGGGDGRACLPSAAFSTRRSGVFFLDRIRMEWIATEPTGVAVEDKYQLWWIQVSSQAVAPIGFLFYYWFWCTHFFWAVQMKNKVLID